MTIQFEAPALFSSNAAANKQRHSVTLKSILGALCSQLPCWLKHLTSLLIDYRSESLVEEVNIH
ncbi:hypothetical protein IC617_13195 [Neiella sp. HB171785]|uniref:Uncharacterized protein n=1 Tax=Neiella litorisoli TaxID=2771431 RepID=A0A8J6UQ60_9GAMM|nr:hypothetical protein [Neiella litorisoli]MBD1390392.1 hypothetical protein [Neiella litorisoli]